jgi:hypothetical protein
MSPFDIVALRRQLAPLYRRLLVEHQVEEPFPVGPAEFKKA